MRTLTLDTSTGATGVQSDQLKGATVLIIAVEGMQYDKVTGTPTGRQAKHVSSTGVIQFDTTILFTPGAKVTVLKN